MQEYTISINKINTIALGMIIPIGLILGIPYVLVHGFGNLSIDNVTFKGIAGGAFIIFIVFLSGALVHELLHGITWSVFAKKGWKAISFGIKWEYMTPYCHCDEPLKKTHFILGAIMPCLILGILPAVISCFTGSFRMWFFGFFFTVASGGDLIAIWMLRKIPRNKMIQDHPEEVGFMVEE